MLDDVIVVLSVAIWAALWLRHLRYHDIIAPGSMGEVLAVGLAGGYMSGQLAGAMNAVFERLTGLDIIHDTLGFSQAALAALFVGVNEESLKFATTLVLVRGLGRLREPLDALVYATAVALGFATLENLGYAFHYGPGALLLRNFSAVPLHVGLGAVWGLGLARIQFGNASDGAWRWLPSLVLAAGLHALYDFFPFSLSGPYTPLSNLLTTCIGFALIKATTGRLRRIFRDMPIATADSALPERPGAPDAGRLAP